MKVLLVEDDGSIAGQLAEALRGENFVVDIARNGEDGKHLGDTGSYDVAVLDMKFGSKSASGVSDLGHLAFRSNIHPLRNIGLISDQ